MPARPDCASEVRPEVSYVSDSANEAGPEVWYGYCSSRGSGRTGIGHPATEANFLL